MCSGMKKRFDFRARQNVFFMDKQTPEENTGKANKSAPKWICGDRTIGFEDGAKLMGILNVTPDSFSDGGRYADQKTAIARAIQIIEEGADIIDIGGESARPGALPVPVEAGVEMERVLPVIEQLKGKTDCIISIDTQKSVVAEYALKAGAQVINDITALESDRRMVEVARKYGAGLIIMHKQGNPYDMQKNPHYENVVAEVGNYLKQRVNQLTAAGINIKSIAIDPGIGFGKTTEHNIRLIAHLGNLAGQGRPVVAGVSRKSFLGRLTGRAVNERLAAGLGALAYCVFNGAHILRVHDVRESRDVLTVLRSILKEKPLHVDCQLNS